MATYTPNLNLEKPGTNEFYTVTKFNANADKIDEAVGENAAGLAGHDTRISSAENDLAAMTEKKAGTIVTTVASTLGDNYLLCNGDYITEDDYPALYPLLPPRNIGAWDTVISSIPAASDSAITDAYYAAGEYALLYVTSGEAVHILHASDILGPWEDVDTGRSLESALIKNLIYANGHWIFGARVSTTSHKLVYAASLTGPWSTATFTTPKGCTFQRLFYLNGNYILVSGSCYSYSNPGYWYYAYSSDLAAWTSKDFTRDASNRPYVSNIIYRDNKYIFVVTGANGYGKVMATTDLSVLPTDLPLFDSFNVHTLQYVNNLWVVTGTSTAADDTNTKIGWSQSLEEPFSWCNIPASGKVHWMGDLWVITSPKVKLVIAYAPSLQGPWVGSSNTFFASRYNQVAEINGDLLLPGNDGASLLAYMPNRRKLPIIDNVSGNDTPTNTFIRVGGSDNG